MEDTLNNMEYPTLENTPKKGDIPESQIDVNKGLFGDTVKQVLMAEDDKIDSLNYVIDTCGIKTTSMDRQVLKQLLCKKNKVDLADTSVYLVDSVKKVKITYIGKGNSRNLARTMPMIKNYVFDNQIKIYKDFGTDSATMVGDMIISNLRLNL